jgi:two-component system, NarL family, nitrate/nitrite response regulator NarL
MESAMVIRVLVATGIRAYRDGLQRVLQGAEGIALVGIAATAEQVVEQSCKLLPSVILLDNAMAKGLALCKPFAGTPKVSGMVMLGTPEAYADMLVCLPAETLAFVARDATVADLLKAIRAAGGADIAAPRLVTPAARHPSAIAHITGREMEILRLMQQGLPNKMISRELGIELSTVKNHVHSILAKLGAHNRGEAISLLYRYEGSGRAAHPSHSQTEPESPEIPLEQPAVA